MTVPPGKIVLFGEHSENNPRALPKVQQREGHVVPEIDIG